MNYVAISNAIAAGTHRVVTYRIQRGRTRYLLEKFNPNHGWLKVAAHGNALRLAVRDLPHRYDSQMSAVIYDANAIARKLEAA